MVSLLIWILIFYGCFKIVGPFLRKRGVTSLGIRLLLAHTILVSFIAVSAFALSGEAQGVFVWFAPMVFDFPLSLMSLSLIKIIVLIFGSSELMATVFAPFISYGLLGGVQYYFVGKLLELIMSKRNLV